jgi:hypothetical protein
MENTNIKKYTSSNVPEAKSSVFSFLLVFILVGLALFVYGIVTYISGNYLVENGQIADGLITKIERIDRKDHKDRDRLRIEFKTLEGEKKTFSHQTDVGAYLPKQGVQVIYLPENPEMAELRGTDDNKNTGIFSAIIGGLFYIVATLSLISIIKTAETEKWLKAHGIKITAEVINIEKVFAGNDKGSKENYQIKAKYKEGATTYIFASRTISNISFELLNSLKMVEILVDPSNYKKFLIETDKIQKSLVESGNQSKIS